MHNQINVKEVNDKEWYSIVYCSGNEYTSTFGAHELDGNLTPHIHNCFKPFVKKCILDGEMIGYDPVTKTFGNYHTTFTSTKMYCKPDIYCVFVQAISDCLANINKAISHL